MIIPRIKYEEGPPGPFLLGNLTGDGGDTVPAGRKTIYDPEMLPAVEMWARRGLTEVEISIKLGISLSTLKNWKNKYVPFLTAIKTSKDVADAKVVQALYNNALGGDTTAQIFWLKNRQPGEWRDKRDIGVEGQIIIEATFEDYDEDSTDKEQTS